MPRPTNFVAFIRNIVREEVQQAIQGLAGCEWQPEEEGGRRTTEKAAQARTGTATRGQKVV